MLRGIVEEMHMYASVRNIYASNMHTEIDTYGFIYKVRDQFIGYIHIHNFISSWHRAVSWHLV